MVDQVCFLIVGCTKQETSYIGGLAVYSIAVKVVPYKHRNSSEFYFFAIPMKKRKPINGAFIIVYAAFTNIFVIGENFNF